MWAHGSADFWPSSGVVICHRTYARIGLLGNPSDGFFGKTISLSLANFCAEVTLKPSDKLCFVPHPLYDGGEYDSLGDLAPRLAGEGYGGGIRLLKAICKRFLEHCAKHSIMLPVRGNFTLTYETSIPRQAGLSGSSAIVCAALNCLLDFYDVADQIPPLERPALVLSAEAELGITAGLQDRVIQVYGGLVYMDFERSLVEERGHGRYEALDPALLPLLWLVHATDPSDSGRMHSDVRRRWDAGDPELIATMAEVAGLAEKGRAALQARDQAALAALMDRNFDLRRQMFGDAALGALNLRMVLAARALGAAAKFTGSGGAIVVLCHDGAQEKALHRVCCKEGWSLRRVSVGPPNFASIP